MSDAVVVIAVSREEIAQAFGKTFAAKLTDIDMEWIARYMKRCYVQHGFWTDLEDAVEEQFMEKLEEARAEDKVQHDAEMAKLKKKLDKEATRA